MPKIAFKKNAKNLHLKKNQPCPDLFYKGYDKMNKSDVADFLKWAHVNGQLQTEGTWQAIV